MPRPKLPGIAAAVPLMVALAAGRPAAADSIDITGDLDRSAAGVGNFTGRIDFRTEEGVGLLVVTLTNTSADSYGGYLTGLLFNVGEFEASVELTAAPASFEAVDGDAFPYGPDFDAGSALHGSWTRQESPDEGIAIGGTGEFRFRVTSSDLDRFTASTFVSGPYPDDFIVQFRSMEEYRDTVPAAVVASTTVMPVPAPLAMGVAGLAGLAVRRRVRRFGVSVW